MGKPTGFIEIARQTSLELPPEERIQNFNEFHLPLHTDEQQAQGARCMDCGVPFCQSGVQLGGMFSGGVYQPGLPRPVRGRLHLRQCHGRSCDCQGERACHRGIRL